MKTTIQIGPDAIKEIPKGLRIDVLNFCDSTIVVSPEHKPNYKAVPVFMRAKSEENLSVYNSLVLELGEANSKRSPNTTLKLTLERQIDDITSDEPWNPVENFKTEIMLAPNKAPTKINKKKQ